MPEMITPEMITIAIASLAAFTFLLILITIAMLSRLKKRVLAIEAKSLEFEEKDELLEAANKITSFESRQNMFQEVVSESQNQLKGHETKLNEHAAMFVKVSQMMDQHVANLAEAVDKITSIEPRLDSFNNKIAESQNQLAGHESKLNEHDNSLGLNSQMAGNNAANLTRAMKQIETLDEKYQDIKVFQSAVEKTCSIISNAFGSIQATKLPKDILTIERKNIQEEARIPS